jgi:hypothetical protein
LELAEVDEVGCGVQRVALWSWHRADGEG